MEHPAESVASSYVEAGDLVTGNEGHGQWLGKHSGLSVRGHGEVLRSAIS
jgi:hypothetical protein